MQQIKIKDSGLEQELRGTLKAADLVDAEGRVLGRFLPVIERVLYEGQAPPELTEEEWEERDNETEGYTTAEIIAYLEKLD